MGPAWQDAAGMKLEMKEEIVQKTRQSRRLRDEAQPEEAEPGQLRKRRALRGPANGNFHVLGNKTERWRAWGRESTAKYTTACEEGS